jgi:hypothetical protein
MQHAGKKSTEKKTKKKTSRGRTTPNLCLSAQCSDSTPNLDPKNVRDCLHYVFSKVRKQLYFSALIVMAAAKPITAPIAGYTRDEVISTAEIDPSYWRTDACCCATSILGVLCIPCIASCGRMFYKRCDSRFPHSWSCSLVLFSKVSMRAHA